MNRSTTARLIQSSAEFDDAFASDFYGSGEICGGGGVEEKNDAIKLPFAGTACKRETQRLKQFAAAYIEIELQFVDKLAEVIGSQRRGIEQESSELAQSFACSVARHDDVGIDPRKDFAGVVVKNQSHKKFQSFAIGGLRAENCCSAFAPG